MKKIVAIHQPNFFPWLGYFDKIAHSDAFIFLDDVQFPKTGGVWTNRVKLLIAGEAQWVTAPIDRNYHGVKNINQMSFQEGSPWRDKMLKGLEVNYRKHHYYQQTIDVIAPLILNPENNIAKHNINAVTTMVRHLGLSADKLYCSSELNVTGSSNDLLCSLTKAVKGDVYMCGGGADSYQDEAIFNSQAIKLQHQNFQHPVYTQLGESSFHSGLSVVDALMNLGWSNVSQLLAMNSHL